MHPFLIGLVVIGLALITPGCSFTDSTVASSRDPLINGIPSEASHLPGVGALVIVYPDHLTVRCTGTLVGTDRVLAAAHCFDNLSTSVRIGFLRGPTIHVDAPRTLLVPVSDKIIHPQYTAGPPPDGVDNYNDISVVTLSHPAGIPPVRMVGPEDADSLIAVGEQVLVAGYGQIVPLDPLSSGTLHHGTTTIAEVGDQEIRLAGNGLPNKCVGDSGGPTLGDLVPGPGSDWRLIGVASRASEDCASGSIETRVDAHLDWIHAQGHISCGSGLSAGCSGDPPTRTIDEACTEHAECLSDLCAENRCALPCSVAENNCPPDLVCSPVPGLTYGACLQPTPPDAGPAVDAGPIADGDAAAPEDECGCSVSAPAGHQAGMVLLLLVGLAALLGGRRLW